MSQGPEQIAELREQVKQTSAEAASAVFVTEERWQDFEDGLPMPEGLFQLYQLQVGRHPHTSPSADFRRLSRNAWRSRAVRAQRGGTARWQRGNRGERQPAGRPEVATLSDSVE